VGGRYCVWRHRDGTFSIDHVVMDRHRTLRQEASTLMEAKILAQADNDARLSEQLSKAPAA
jgi:hypothetical protein